MKNIHVGCCGWAVRGGKKAYYERFKCIELQDTFYKLPKLETVKRWKESAPSDFIFCMKAWQVITHPPTSPTWRKAGIKVQEPSKDLYGMLKPTKENIDAWSKMLEVAKVIDSYVIVIQTPPSFGYSEENFSSVDKFFGRIPRNDIIIGWECRGTWSENLDAVAELCRRHEIVHVTDIMRLRPAYRHKILYVRLHGLGKGETNYSYKYTDEDLSKLLYLIKQEMAEREMGFVMFNNVWMAEDALRFKHILSA